MNNEITISTDSTEHINIHKLRANSLYKSFGKKKVVQGVDFEMTTGEVLGLLGPNGAGKTTTFYMIVGFHKPTAGEIFLDNHQKENVCLKSIQCMPSFYMN